MNLLLRHTGNERGIKGIERRLKSGVTVYDVAAETGEGPWVGFASSLAANIHLSETEQESATAA